MNYTRKKFVGELHQSSLTARWVCLKLGLDCHVWDMFGHVPFGVVPNILNINQYQYYNGHYW